MQASVREREDVREKRRGHIHTYTRRGSRRGDSAATVLAGGCTLREIRKRERGERKREKTEREKEKGRKTSNFITRAA